MGQAEIQTKSQNMICLTILILILPELVQWGSGSSINYKGFGELCDLSDLCDPSRQLACIGGLCQCESPSNQRYDNTSTRCLSVVGGRCTSSSNAVPTTPPGRKEDCIQNAVCVDITEESGVTHTECQCVDGFIENSTGECTPGIGKPCSYQPNECNTLGMVVCKNGFCQCLDELQVYDKDMKRCVSPAGTHCKYDNIQLGCVKNAICYPLFYWTPPKCLCKLGFVRTKSRHCVPEADYNRKNRNNVISQFHQTTGPTGSTQSTETVTV